MLFRSEGRGGVRLFDERGDDEHDIVDLDRLDRVRLLDEDKGQTRFGTKAEV